MNRFLMSALNSGVQRCGFSSFSWLMRSMPKLQCIDSSRRMYWYCSAAPVILFCRPNKIDRKSTRLNSSHGYISYAVFCLKKKKNNNNQNQDPETIPHDTTLILQHLPDADLH